MTNPIPSTDSTFLKYFAMLIVFLSVLSIALLALGLYISSKNPPLADPGLHATQVSRIAPVGGVYAGDTGQAAMLAAQEEAKKAASSQVAYGGTTDGHEIFGKLCHACHETGAGGAPRIDDKAKWAPRVAEGEETLVKHAIDGYTGTSGFMPPKGGNPALSDAQVRATVEWMLSQVK